MNIISLHKAILWEEAKGKLRAMVSANVQTNSEDKHHVDWELIKNKVKAFIGDLELFGLHE